MNGLKNIGIFIYLLTYFIVKGIKQDDKDGLSIRSSIQNDQDMQKNNDNTVENKNKYRQLLPQQMRMTFDTSSLQTNTSLSNPLMIQLLNLLNTAKQFFTTLITINQPIVGTITVPSASSVCNTYTYTTLQKTNGFDNTDLQILVAYSIDNSLSYNFNVSSSICEKDASSYRAIIAELNITLKSATATLSDYQFTLLLKQVQHEIMHVLALDVQLVIYFKNVSNQFYNPIPINIPNQTLSFPNTLLWAQTYYNCTTITSIPIEISTNGNIHWNRVILLDDIMSGLYTQGEGLWSGINNAILKDTGWYTVKEDMIDHSIRWGKNKQCDFVTLSCGGSGYFSEFCTTNNIQGLIFSQNGMGQCQTFYPTTSNQYSKAPVAYQACMFNVPVINRHCWDSDNNEASQNQDLVSQLNYTFTYTSRAFQSSLTPILLSEYSSFACYSSQCSSDNLTIYIQFGDYQFICTVEGEFLTPSKSFEYLGNIKCPTNFVEFCTSPQSCQNFCSSHGFCLNGKCQCLSDTSGDGCECAVGFYYKDGICRQCSQECKSCSSVDETKCQDCDEGYYLLNEQCYQCGPSCLTCNATTPAQCLTCAQGYYLDSTTKLCTQCTDNCLYCTGLSTCIACQDGYGFNSTNYCSVTCDYNCKKCYLFPLQCQECYSSKQLNTTSLTCTCPSSQYEDLYGRCQDCKQNCIQCTTIKDCQKCKDGYQLRPHTQTCVLQNLADILSLYHFISIFILLFLFN